MRESQTIPQIEYQDLGLTFKATARVIRSGEVALTMDMKITALGGSALNGVPVLNNRSYSGVVTLKEGSGVVIVSAVDKEESRALERMAGADGDSGNEPDHRYGSAAELRELVDHCYAAGGARHSSRRAFADVAH